MIVNLYNLHKAADQRVCLIEAVLRETEEVPGENVALRRDLIRERERRHDLYVQLMDEKKAMKEEQS